MALSKPASIAKCHEKCCDSKANTMLLPHHAQKQSVADVKQANFHRLAVCLSSPKWKAYCTM